MEDNNMENVVPVSFEAVQKSEKPKKTGLIIIIAIVIVLLVGLICGIIFLMSLKGGAAKIGKAIDLTINEAKESNLLYQTLDVSKIVEDKEYSLSIKLDTKAPLIGDVSINSDVAVDRDIVQFTGDVDLNYIPPVEYTITVNDNRVTAKVPIMNKYLFVYNYTSDDNEYIRNFVDTDVINAQIGQLYTQATQAALPDEVIAQMETTIGSAMKKAKINKLPKVSCVIDNKEVSCSGYKLTLNKDIQKDIVDGLGDILIKDYKNAFEANRMDVEGYVERMRSQIDEDLGISIYLYKDELAKIIVEGKELMVIDFKGGDYRCQNLDISVNDAVIYAVLGDIQDGVENFKVSGENDSVSYKYNTNYGDLQVNAIVSEDSLSVDMDIARSKNELKLDIDYFDYGDTYFGGKIKLTDGASVSEVSGEEFDVGSAKEEAINAIKQEITSLVLGLLGLGF